jgi:uncharacterized protein (DUF305 family)
VVAVKGWQTGRMDTSPDELADLSLDQLVELEARAARASTSASDGGDIGDHDEAEIVLPWWQHPVNMLTIVVTVGILAAMIGWMVGDSGSRIRHNEVDTGFLQDMREHHEQAIVMGFIFRALPDTNPGLDSIARAIVQGQSLEVGRMIQLLRSFGESEANEGETAMTWMGHASQVGQMPGMASQSELDQLGNSSGRDADELFVKLMTTHHTAGVEMAEFAAERAENDEVRLMAASMAGAQRGEIIEMSQQID